MTNGKRKWAGGSGYRAQAEVGCPGAGTQTQRRTQGWECEKKREKVETSQWEWKTTSASEGGDRMSNDDEKQEEDRSLAKKGQRNEVERYTERNCPMMKIREAREKREKATEERGGREVRERERGGGGMVSWESE